VCMHVGAWQATLCSRRGPWQSLRLVPASRGRASAGLRQWEVQATRGAKGSSLRWRRNGNSLLHGPPARRARPPPEPRPQNLPPRPFRRHLQTASSCGVLQSPYTPAPLWVLHERGAPQPRCGLPRRAPARAFSQPRFWGGRDIADLPRPLPFRPLPSS